MKTQKCPYSVLDIPLHSKVPEIKKAYRNLALKWHPDRAPIYMKEHYSEKFCEVSEAYTLLMDKKKKDTYDKYGIIDDGLSDIIVNEAQEILTKFNQELGEEGFYVEEESEEPEKKSFGKKCKEFFNPGPQNNPNVYMAKCYDCKGTGEIQKEVGFFIIDEHCASCKGTGEVERETSVDHRVKKPFYNNWGSQ